MRLACLFGRHEWGPTGRVEPPQEWNTRPAPDWVEFESVWGRPVKAPEWRGFPTFILKHCLHCPASDYDMEFPDEQRG